MDVKIAFLHGDLEEIFFMKFESFVVKDKKNYVCRLKKSHLKQILREWYKCFGAVEQGFLLGINYVV